MGAVKTLVIATLVAAAVAQPAEAAKRKAPSCAKAETTTVRSSTEVRVYRELQDAGNEVVHDRLFACWRPTGRRMLIALGYSSSGYDQTYANVRLSASRVALSVRRNSDACKYGCTDLALAGSGSVELFDVRHQRQIHREAVPFPGQVSDVALTSGGGLAWIAGDLARAADRAGTRTLDSGVAPRPLGAEGSIVSWRRGGQERFARLTDGTSVPELRGRPRRSCAMKGSSTVRRSPSVRVFTAPGRRDGEDVVRLYGCRNADGRKQVLTEAFDDEYTTSARFDSVRLSGRFVAWHEEDTDISCKADCPPGYDGTTDTVTVHDLVRRRPVRTIVADPDALVLTRHGGLAWVIGKTLLATDRSGSRTLDLGGISFLRGQTTIVSWRRGGTERFARLGPAR